MRAEFYVIPSKGLEQAILGREFMRKYRVVIDVANDTMYFGMPDTVDRDQVLTLDDKSASYVVMAQDCIGNPGEIRCCMVKSRGKALHEGKVGCILPRVITYVGEQRSIPVER